MKSIRSHYLCRSTSWGLVALLLGGLVAPGLSAWAAAPAQTVLVFPVTSAAEGAPADLGQRATGALSMALDDAPGFEAMEFSSTSPSVRRAVSEGRIRQVDVDEGNRDLGTALSMAAALRADYLVLASVQSYMVKQNSPLSVELILAGQMYAVGPNTDPTTGEPIGEPKVYKAFGVSGASTPRAKYNGSEAAMAQEALRDAAFKAAQTLAGIPVVVEGATGRKKSNGAYKWVLLAVLLGALAVGVNSGGGGGASPPAIAPPPTNVVVTPFADSIRVSWFPPSQTPSFYQVRRAVDGGSFALVSGNIAAGIEFFNDYDLLAGTHVYQYQVRAVYGASTFSVWVLTGATQWPAP